MLPKAIFLGLCSLLLAVHAYSPDCAEQKGGAAEDWDAVLDEDGNLARCRKTTVEEECFKNYLSPSTGVLECCPKGTKFKPLSGGAKNVGGCCAPGEEVQGDGGKAGCCPPGKKWKWDTTTNSGSCIDPPPRDPTDCATKSPCANKNICPCNGLGIEYGKCYTLQDTNGMQLGREINNEGIYRSGGEINNIVFRVCKSQDDCSADAGWEVPADGTWVMQDQLGLLQTPGYAWWGTSRPHMGATADAKVAAKFTGELYCYNGQCGICMRTDSDNPGLVAPCPMPGVEQKVHVGMSAGNPMNCKAYFYQETPCFRGPPGFKKE